MPVALIATIECEDCDAELVLDGIRATHWATEASNQGWYVSTNRGPYRTYCPACRID
jgi:hypothetical protein